MTEILKYYSYLNNLSKQYLYFGMSLIIFNVNAYMCNDFWCLHFRDGRLQEGDQILAIDGQPLDSNISHQQAISILQQARGLVELVVARGGITAPDHQGTTTATAAVSLERSPSAVSDTSKGSDMVVSNFLNGLVFSP